MIHNILSLVYLENIHDYGHSKELAQLTSTGGTSSEPSPQYEQLHQDFERSRNYQTEFHNNPHLKREDEVDIKFIKVASEDMTNTIQYPSFHFIKLQRPNQRASTYIKA
ncbi:hypothetical protein ACS0TY_021132 [Phlomoides rotata]